MLKKQHFFFKLQLLGIAKRCDILVKSISRFERRIFPGDEIHKKRQLLNFAHEYLKQASTYGGVLEELQIELLHNSGCEHYPYLEMEETCAQVN